MRRVMGEKVARQFSTLGTTLMATGTVGMVAEQHFIGFADAAWLFALGFGWWVASLVLFYFVRKEAKTEDGDAEAESESEDDKESDTGDDDAQANEEGSDADTQ